MTQPFLISKKIVSEAHLQVKSRKGSAGVDAQSVEDFQRNLKKNLYRIWNDTSSGATSGLRTQPSIAYARNTAWTGSLFGALLGVPRGTGNFAFTWV